jgi:hypothetical protein
MACALHRVGATAKHPTTSCSNNRKRTRLPAPRPGHTVDVPLAASTSACRACACARCHRCRTHHRRVASSARHLTTSPPGQAQVTRAQHRVPFTCSWLCPMLADATTGRPASAYSVRASSHSGTPSAVPPSHSILYPCVCGYKVPPPPVTYCPPPLSFLRYR